MQYLGGKFRLGRFISSLINDEIRRRGIDTYIEPFCGAANVGQYVECKNKILSDVHPYLIAMWTALANGWEPPSEISKSLYVETKENLDRNPALSGFVGFGCSFSGKWFGGYARSRKCNFAQTAKGSLEKKAKNLRHVKFVCGDYAIHSEAKGALIYCDPPYQTTTGYANKFCHSTFIEWAQHMSKNNTVLVSEYEQNVPTKAHIVFRTSSVRDMQGAEKRKITAEAVYTFKKLEATCQS